MIGMTRGETRAVRRNPERARSAQRAAEPPLSAVAMRHAGPSTLARIVPLLEKLRAYPVLCEQRPGIFYLKSRAFLHFHDHPSGVFADVRLAEDFVRLPVTTASQQVDLLERIDDCLFTVESRSTDKLRRSRRGG